MKPLPSPPIHLPTHPPTHPLLKKRLNKWRTNKFLKIFESFFILFYSSSSLNTNGSKFRQEKKWNGRRRKEGLLIEYKVRINLKSKFSIFLTSEVNRAKYRARFLSVSLSLFRINKKKVNILLKLRKIFLWLNWVVFIPLYLSSIIMHL